MQYNSQVITVGGDDVDTHTHTHTHTHISPPTEAILGSFQGPAQHLHKSTGGHFPSDPDQSQIGLFDQSQISIF